MATIDAKLFKELHDKGLVRIGGTGELGPEHKAAVSRAFGKTYLIRKTYNENGEQNGESMDQIVLDDLIKSRDQYVTNMQKQIDGMDALIEAARQAQK